MAKSESPTYSQDDWKFAFEEGNSKSQDLADIKGIGFKTRTNTESVRFSGLKAFGD